MTRKDYVLIAAAIVATQDRIKAQAVEDHRARRDGTDLERLAGVRKTAAHLCEALAADNPRFDKGTFLKACGYGGTTMNPRDPALDLRPLPGNIEKRWRTQQEADKSWSVYEGEGFRKGGFPSPARAATWAMHHFDLRPLPDERPQRYVRQPGDPAPTLD